MVKLEILIMKKLLLILLYLPIIGFSQSNNCVDNFDGKQIIWKSITNGTHKIVVTLFSNGKYELITHDDFYGPLIIDGSINSNAEPAILDIIDRWWISESGKTLNILYNYITYEFPIGTGYPVKKGRWTNRKPKSGLVEIVSIGNSYNELPCLIKKYVESRINTWQTKSEFEKIATYNQRVNEISRNNMIDLFQKEAFEHYKQRAFDDFLIKDITIQKYDAENETFLLETTNQSFLLPVPIKDAESFKKNFDPKNFRNLKMTLKDYKFIISYIEYPFKKVISDPTLRKKIITNGFHLSKKKNIDFGVNELLKNL